MLDPKDYVNIFGHTFAQREHKPVLELGRLVYDRHRAGRIGCAHPVALSTLNRIGQELRIRSAADLASNLHNIGNYKGSGVTTYYAACAILRDNGYDVEEIHGEDVTYYTVKARAKKAAKKTAPRHRPRRAGPPSDAAEGASAS